MVDTDGKQAIPFLRSEIERARRRIALLEERPINESNQKILAQTRTNVDELTKALAAYGVHDA